MLISNTVNLEWHLNIELLFDDNTKKSGVIDTGDYILLKWRRNNNIYNRVGCVAEVYPVPVTLQPLTLTSSLIVDFSYQYSASKVRLSAKDILDFRIITKEQAAGLGPDFIVTDDMFKDDYPLQSSSMGIDYAGLDLAEVLE